MFKEFSAKKVDDAIKQGLAELGLTLDDVTVEVLDAGGFLRKAKVCLTVDEKDPAPVTETKDVKPDKKLEKDEKVESTEEPAQEQAAVAAIAEEENKPKAVKPAQKKPVNSAKKTSGTKKTTTK